MTAYYIVLALSTALSLAAESVNTDEHILPSGKYQYKFTTRFLLFLTLAVLCFIGGTRFWVGTDYGAYYRSLETYAPRLNEAFRNMDEPGLPLLATIVKWFTNDGAYAIFVYATLTIVLLMLPNYRYSTDFFFVTILFVLSGPWTGLFNGVRQYLAASMIFVGHRFVYEKKFWKYMIAVFFAFCFHRSAVIMIIPYFILRNRITTRNVLLLALGTLLVSYNYETVFEFVGFLKESDMSMSDGGYYSTSVNLLRILVACAPAVVSLILYWGKDKTKEQTFYINAMIMNGAAMVAASGSAYLARVNIYTSVFVPLALSKLIDIRNKKAQLIYRVCIIGLFGIFFFYEVQNSPGLQNFRWIWERTD